MSTAGMKVGLAPPASIVDQVIALLDGSVRLQSVSDFQLQLLSSGTLSSMLAALGTNILFYGTEAEAQADVGYSLPRGAWVTNDPDPAKNGIYKLVDGDPKSWEFMLDFPNSWQRAEVSGGTGNALELTTKTTVNTSQMIWFIVAEDNVAGGVTLSFNGNDPLTGINIYGDPVIEGALQAGALVVGAPVAGGQFQFLIDNSAQAAAALALEYMENAQAAAAQVATVSITDLAALLSNTAFSYTAGTGKVQVAAGDYVTLVSENWSYEVAALGVTDYDLATAGGVLLYVLPGERGYNLKAFNATGDGVANDGPIIQKWVDKVFATLIPGYAPKGKFRSDQQITGAFTAAATGPGDNKDTLGRFMLSGAGIEKTIFYFPSTSGFDLLAKSFQQCFDLRDFTVTTGQADGGTAIYLRNQYAFFGSYTAQHDIQRVTCRGDDGYGGADYWTKNLDLFNISAANILACSFYGPSAGATDASYGIGIDLRTSTTPGVGTVTEPGAMTSINIKDTNIVFLGQGIIVDNYVQAVKIGHGTAILNGYDGIVVPAGGSEIRQISVIGVEISVNGTPISFRSAVSGSEIVGNHIAIAASKNGIELVTDAGASNGAGNIIASNDFNSKDGGTTGDAIYVNTSFNGVVIDNNNFNGILRAIELTANAQHVKVGAGNNYSNVTQKILDNSAARANRVHYSDDRGVVAQATSKATGVALNKRCGTITTHNEALAAGAEATFTLTNSRLAGEAVLSLNVINPNYSVRAYSMANGSCGIALKNISAGSLSDAVAINFVLLPVD